VHELGHFLAAKYFKVKVLRFSLGFGPRLFGKTWGETEYRLSLVPLGGYVNLLGMSEEEEKEVPEEDKPRSFHRQSVLRRIAIVAAGPLFNFFWAIVVLAFVYMYGYPALAAKIGKVVEESPAFKAGLMENDVITNINGQNVKTWDDMTKYIGGSGGSVLRVEFKRDDVRYFAMVTPVPDKGQNLFGEEIDRYVIGVGISENFEEVILRFNPFMALWKATKDTAYFSKMTVVGLGKMIVGKISPRQNLSGPISIFQMTGQVANKGGVIPFLLLMAVISISLAIINLFPIPVLDGGHLLFFFIELCKGSPVPVKFQEYAYKAGLALLILLMVFVCWNDIDRIFPGFLFKE
jgi:regulator of sigma E protease